MSDPTTAHIDPTRLPELLAQLALEEVRLADAKSRQVALRKEIDAVALELHEATSMKSLDAKIAGLGKVGTLSINESHARAVVEDATAFLAWVEEHYPGEVEYIVQVRPSYEAAVIKGAELDVKTGVVMHGRTKQIIPGMRAIPGGEATGTSFRIPAKDKDRIREALAAHVDIQPSDVPEQAVGDVAEAGERGNAA